MADSQYKVIAGGGAGGVSAAAFLSNGGKKVLLRLSFRLGIETKPGIIEASGSAHASMRVLPGQTAGSAWCRVNMAIQSGKDLAKILLK